MNHSDRKYFQELVEKSEKKTRDTFFLESIVDSDLKSLIEKNTSSLDIGYISRHILQAIDEVKKCERNYLNAISIYHSRLQDCLSILERE